MKRFIPLILLTVIIGAVWFSGVLDYLSLDNIKTHRDALRAQVETHYLLSVLAFVGAYIAAVALSLPIATVLTLLGGFLFGTVMGTLLIVTGATIGATILFLVAKSALGQSLRDKAGPFYDKVAGEMQGNAVGYMFFMRLVPLFPFFLVNIIPALFNVRLLPYVATTFLGIIPGTFVYANVGQELGNISSLHDIVSRETSLAFLLLGLFALVPVIYKKVKKKNV
jgi:uncharacterized membrane protein YdjX (TVP38/TMEM64 family)